MGIDRTIRPFVIHLGIFGVDVLPAPTDVRFHTVNHKVLGDNYSGLPNGAEEPWVLEGAKW
jgi:hypothetical protein